MINWKPKYCRRTITGKNDNIKSAMIETLIEVHSEQSDNQLHGMNLNHRQNYTVGSDSDA